MRRVSGIMLIVLSTVFAATMVMRAIGRFLIFLVVDRPEVGAGFLLWTFVSTAIALYLAWQLGSKGADLLASTDRKSVEDRRAEVEKKAQE